MKHMTGEHTRAALRKLSPRERQLIMENVARLRSKMYDRGIVMGETNALKILAKIGIWLERNE